MHKPPKKRNPVAISPLLKKGGAHARSKSALRSSSRVQLKTEIDDWQSELAFEKTIKSDVESDRNPESTD